MTKKHVAAIYNKPLKDLLLAASEIHSQNFLQNEIQRSTLLSIKTGGCPENCAYCPQSAHYKTGIERRKLMPLGEVLRAALAAKEGGSTRFCMGAAWREVKDGQAFDEVVEMVRAVKSLDLEVLGGTGH